MNKLISKANRKTWALYTLEQRAKRIAAMIKGINRPEILQKKSLLTRVAFQNPEAKQRLLNGIKRANTAEHRAKVSSAVKESWKQPCIRRKHLRYGITIKGGTGRPPAGFEKLVADSLYPLGYIHNFCVRNIYAKRAPDGRIVSGIPIVFFIDSALPERKIAIECDGPRHRAYSQKPIDKRRDKFLRRMGWKVIRVNHEALR